MESTVDWEVKRWQINKHKIKRKTKIQRYKNSGLRNKDSLSVSIDEIMSGGKFT